MAAELTINLPSFTYIKAPFSENILPGILQVTVNGKQVVHGAIGLTTGDSVLSKCNVSTIGYVYMKNLDITNNIQISDDGTIYALMLKPGEFALFRWNAAAIHAKATAGTPILEYWMVED
jgi:hypothetical protein